MASDQTQNETPTVPPRTLLIEGWRGINHSIALVNQYQILELLKFSGLTLYHHDLPFFFPHWTRTASGSGFNAADCRRVVISNQRGLVTVSWSTD